MSLDGRVALVTGASHGIGFGIADHLASLGMAVAVNDVGADIQDAAEKLRQHGARIVAIEGDVSRKSDVDAMFERVESELGPLWLVVNNAGVIPTAATVDMLESEWDRAMAIDAKGVFLCSQAAIRRMIPRNGGRIVNISSIASVIVRTGQIGYCSAKAAVNHFTRCLAVEVAPHGITVNALLPGMTGTELLEASLIKRGMSIGDMLPLIPSGRFAAPADHAALTAFFASDEARHITAQLVSVDGGQSQFMPLPV
jgi:NAD(P)-dependent dehydrogenase (short-subunit alcohol dehydrogenase family)